MTKARIWQFNAVCSLILLISAVGIFWSWRDVVGFGHAVNTDIAQVPITKRIDFASTDKEEYQGQGTPTANTVDTPVTSTQEHEEDKTAVLNKEVPASMNLDVPFTSQAPEKNWDQPWQDACEEAAVLMLTAYYKDFGLSPLFAKDEILKMVAWEEKKGWGTSIEIEKIEQLTQEFVVKQLKNKTLTIKIIENPSIEQIKQYIANGTPVYVVADGKVLPNPHFRNGGPEYHALIIRGYTEDSFITNDPGTQFGKNFSYTYNDLMKSVRDWNAGDVKNGRRVILVIE